MVNLWRLHLNTDGKKPIGKYCIENNIAAMGWSLYYRVDGVLAVSQKDRIDIGNDFKKYEHCVKQHNIIVEKSDPKAKYESVSSVRRMANEVKDGDLMWTRYNGLYYLARVSKESSWSFVADENVSSLDACNQISNMNWYEVGDESKVPGVISTSFIQGSTLQRICLKGAMEFSGLLYDHLAESNDFSFIKIEKNMPFFFNMLHANDAEDLLCLWLYYKYKFITIPSTNKIATPLYECVLLNTSNGNPIYIQVKKGDSEKAAIKKEAYTELAQKGEVWLLQTTDNYIDKDFEADNIKIADPDTLYLFAMSKESRNYLSPAILRWVEFFSSQS